MRQETYPVAATLKLCNNTIFEKGKSLRKKMQSESMDDPPILSLWYNI